NVTRHAGCAGNSPAREVNRHTRAAIHSRNGRAAIIRPIYGNVAIAFKWLVHQWRMADPYGVFNRRRGEEAFLQFALKLRGADLVIIARTGRSESELHDRKILRFKARINRRHAKQSPSKQSRAEEQDQRKGDLPYHQRAAQREARRA